jgi:hypothetical protein
MQTVKNLIVEAHALEQQISKLSRETAGDNLLITQHTHYAEPRFSVCLSDDVGRHALFKIVKDHLLLVNSEGFDVDDINDAFIAASRFINQPLEPVAVEESAA